MKPALISRRPASFFDLVVVPVTFQDSSTISISRFYIRGPAHPSSFVSLDPPTYPSFAHPPRNGHRPCFVLPVLGIFYFLFLPVFFFNHSSPHRRHAATDRDTVRRVSCCTHHHPHSHHAPVHPSLLTTPLLPPAPITPFSSCSGLRSGQFPGRVPAIILPGGIQRGATRRQAANVTTKHVERIPFVALISSGAGPTLLQWYALS